jgi:signal transduction histidine kinase
MAARAAARAQAEKALALALDRLLVESNAARGRLVAFDAAGHETARVERGPIDEARAARALESAGRSTGDHLTDEDSRCGLLQLAARPLAIVYLERQGPVEPALWSEATARAAIAVGNAQHLADTQTRGELVATLAHEIRNPLAGILSFSDLLPEEKTELPAKYIHLMGHIQDDAQRLKKLIEGLLSLLKERQVPREPVPVAEVLDLLASRFRPWAMRRGVTLEVAASGAVLADRESLALIVGNLMANAVAATPSGGRIDVSSRLGPDRETRWGVQGRAVWITVVDTGPGLGASVLESARTGGLHIVRDLVSTLGGTIWLEEAPGGARLVFRLPASGP